MSTSMHILIVLEGFTSRKYLKFRTLTSFTVPTDPKNLRSREVLPPTPVRFPDCKLQIPDGELVIPDSPPLVDLLRTIQRPADIKITHLEALGLHVIADAAIKDIIPDSSYLPPESWMSIEEDQIEDINPSTTVTLNNGRDSPGVKIYLERIRELSIPNDAAYHTIRRLPAPPGGRNAQLGNAYEFYKHLESLAGFWIDTSISNPATTDPDPDAMDTDEGPDPTSPTQIQNLIGTGSQTPPEFRNSLLSTFTKFIAYDFGCNVSFPRIEPRLYISSPPSTSSFPTNISFIYRTPTNRASARLGIVEGPLAALSARHMTSFRTPHDSLFDLCREVASVLVTAQQRARETKTEPKLDEDLWWCHKPRWGGGPGGPIGREADKADEIASTNGNGEDETSSPAGTGPSPARKKTKKMSLYDNYRNVRPPSSTWDRKTKYMAIGKPAALDYDDIFLLSCLNHHISIVRVRVPLQLLHELEGQKPAGSRERCVMWRSKWYDMFLVEDRVEAMTCIWGMMAYMMRKTDGGETVAEAHESRV
jgi:hypothetical protein